ncbi:MAG: helix-turn-helix domain-containing protein [Bilifractor sp.]
MPRKKEESIQLTSESTIGDRIHALRIANGLSQTDLARKTELTSRVIRYYEANEKTPGVEALQKIAKALNVSISYFMDQDTFDHELKKEAFLDEVKDKYGSRSRAKARMIVNDAHAYLAGGGLSDEDRRAFMDEMMDLFNETQQMAKDKFTRKDLRK